MYNPYLSNQTLNYRSVPPPLPPSPAPVPSSHANIPNYNVVSKNRGNSNLQCSIIGVNDIKSNKDKLEGTWVTVELINGMLYSMYIENIGIDDISGALFLGIVPCDVSDCHSKGILANALILYDYINSIILTPPPNNGRTNCWYASKQYSPGSKLKIDGEYRWCHADGKWKNYYHG